MLPNTKEKPVWVCSGTVHSCERKTCILWPKVSETSGDLLRKTAQMNASAEQN